MVSKKKIIEYYNQTYGDYKLIWINNENLALHYGYWDSKTKTHNEALLNMNRVLAKLAGIKKTDKVLDAGCGLGGSSMWLAKTFGCKVVGITLSKKQVGMARKFAKEHKVSHLVEFYQMDFTNTKFHNATFDVIWAIESVCYAEDKLDFLKEAHRILKTKGRVVIADGTQLKKQLTNNEKKMMYKWREGWVVPNLATPEKFRNDMIKIGFRRTKFLDITKHILPSSKRLYRYAIPAIILGKPLEVIGLRTKTQTGNILAAYYQYKLVKKGIGGYGIFYGEK